MVSRIFPVYCFAVVLRRHTLHAPACKMILNQFCWPFFFFGLQKMAEDVRAKEEQYKSVMQLTGSVEDSDVMATLSGLPARWDAVQSELDKRLKCMAEAEGKLNDYESELHPLGNWLAWAEGELDTLKRRENTSDLVQQQVDKCEVSGRPINHCTLVGVREQHTNKQANACACVQVHVCTFLLFEPLNGIVNNQLECSIWSVCSCAHVLSFFLQKLVSDVKAHEPYVAGTSKKGEHAVEEAKVS